MQASAGAESSRSREEPSPKAQRKGSRKPGDKKPYVRKKRPPVRLSQKPNDIYINRKTEFAAQLARSHRLLDQGCSELNIHGLGVAIHRAINLALQLQETSSHDLEVATTTSTVELVDDLEPLDDETDYHTQTRPSSAIHIRLYKKAAPHAAAVGDETTAAPPKQKT